MAAKSDLKTVYDTISGGYDNLYQSDEDKQEELEIRTDLLSMDLTNVLDVGCGTGLLLDMLGSNISEQDYLGIDPSTGMLDQLVEKHPERKYQLLSMGYEEYIRAFGEPNEDVTLISLFNPMAHLPIIRLQEILSALKCEHYIMIPKRGYAPWFTQHIELAWSEDLSIEPAKSIGHYDIYMRQ